MSRRRVGIAAAAALLLAIVATTLVPSANSATGCGQVVEAGIARLEGCFTQAGSVYTSTQTTDLNGIQVRATAQRRLVVDTAADRIRALDASGKPSPIDVAVLGIPNTTKPSVVTLRGLDFIVKDEGEQTIGYADITPPVLAGINPIGTLDVPLKITEPDDDGAIGELNFKYSLPGALTVLGHQGSVSVVAQLFANTGARFNGVDIEASGMTLGGVLGVDTLTFSYRESLGLWDGELILVFPRPTDPTEGGYIGGTTRIRAKDGRAQLERIGLTGDVGIELFPLVYLQSLSGYLETTPQVAFGAKAKFTAGKALPKSVPVVGGNRLLEGNLALDIKVPNERVQTGSVGLSGDASLFQNIPVGDAHLRFAFLGPPNSKLTSVSFGARAGLGLPRFTREKRGNVIFLEGRIEGWWENADYDRQQRVYRNALYNFEGSLRLSVLGWDVSGAQAVFSNRGIAACVKPIWWSPWVGGGYSYSSGFSFLGGWSSCGIGSYRETARRFSAAPVAFSSTARAAPESTSVLELSPREQVLRIEGDDRVPSFTMESSDGRRIDYRWRGKSPVFGPNRDWVILGDPRSETAYVLMRDPESTWTVTGTSRAGIAGIAQAATRPPPRVRARVSGDGFRRTVHWQAEGLRKGDRIQFYETTGRKFKNPVLTTRRASGSKRFTPAIGAKSRHELHAIVMRRGSPFADNTLDTFRLQPPKAPGRPRGLRAQRRQSSVVVSWKKSRRARHYVAMLRTPDGKASIPRYLPGTRSRVVFRNAPVQRRMTAKVYAIGRLGFPSKATKTTFRTSPPDRRPGAAARRMLASVSASARGKLRILVPCSEVGQCTASVAAEQGGALTASGKARVVPGTWRRMNVKLPRPLRKRLASGKRVRLDVTVGFEQLGRTGSARKTVSLRRPQSG